MRDFGVLQRSSLLAVLSMAVAMSSGAQETAICEPAEGLPIWTSPLDAAPGTPLKVMAVATAGPLQALVLSNARGDRLAVIQSTARGGPPWSLSAEVGGLVEGAYRIEAWQQGQRVGCLPLEASTTKIVVPAQSHRAQTWNESTEAFYSAWIAQLFDAPPDESLDFPSLQPVLRDPARNFLHNHLGLDEDRSLPVTPDCADLPYSLRAYFAWKVGLPMGFRACTRGTAQAPPRCGPPTITLDFARGIVPPAMFKQTNRQLVDTVHSGSARTALDSDASDFYPIALSRKALWPGSVYADPYGHVLVLTQWVPQTPDRPGQLLAVDAQPDNTVARKRFWEGNFLYAQGPSAGAGFKAFRPLIRSGSGSARPLSNGELFDAPGFAPFSLEQDALSPEDFYVRLGKLIHPAGLEPKQAYEATLDALVEQLEARVRSVDNGETYFRRNPDSVIAMPRGAAIFETVGPWEDFSTPARDLRLIIAMNVLNELPEKILRHPELFRLNGTPPTTAKTAIETLHERRSRERYIVYQRSDGSTWTLSVAEVLARKPALEMAYNPNDCAEHRWGAESGSEEYRPCRRHAPPAQRAQMEGYRVWFREARRPTR